MQRFFAPGRTELAGNHTDHQLGRVLAASVDVGIRARAARRAGGRTAPFPAGVYRFRRVVVAGAAPTGAGVTATPLTEPFPVSAKNHLKPDFPNAIEARFWDCALEIPMKDGSARAFAEAEQVARDRTFVPTQVDAANTLTLLAPDHFLCRASGGAWAGAAAGRTASRETVWWTQRAFPANPSKSWTKSPSSPPSMTVAAATSST